MKQRGKHEFLSNNYNIYILYLFIYHATAKVQEPRLIGIFHPEAHTSDPKWHRHLWGGLATWLVVAAHHHPRCGRVEEWLVKIDVGNRQPTYCLSCSKFVSASHDHYLGFA